MRDSYSGKFFFVSSTRSAHFFQHHQLELRTSKTYSKRQNLVQNKNIDVQNLENRILPLFFTRHYATFFEIFLIPPKGLIYVCFDILQHNGCQKIPKGPPFHILRHCDTVQKFKNLMVKFFKKLFKVSQWSPFKFFHILQPTGVSQSPKGPPFYNFEP